jgi:hypothetical protein
MGKINPTKDPEFQKVIRHFVTTHSAMKIGKSKAKASQLGQLKKKDAT